MKILVAEDDAVSAKLVELTLKQWGHDVIVACNGVFALAEYSKARFDVVITDWMMPEMDGLELTRRIREVRAREYPWVILLTTKSFKENYASAMEAGVDDFLTKPLDRDLLRVRLMVAARVQRAKQQVVELTKLLPICMHCKSVKSSTEDGWRRVEEFLSKTNDVSHGYCPDCYWDKSVAPDLGAFLEERGPGACDHDGIDSGALAALDEYDRAKVPGIGTDTRLAFRDLAVKMAADLETASNGVRLAPAVLQRYRSAADALGAFALASRLQEIAGDPFGGHGPAAREELDRVIAILFPTSAAA